MKRLMVAAVLALILTIGNLGAGPRTTAQASGCEALTGGTSADVPYNCPVPLWLQGPTTVA